MFKELKVKINKKDCYDFLTSFIFQVLLFLTLVYFFVYIIIIFNQESRDKIDAYNFLGFKWYHFLILISYILLEFSTILFVHLKIFDEKTIMVGKTKYLIYSLIILSLSFYYFLFINKVKKWNKEKITFLAFLVPVFYFINKKEDKIKYNFWVLNSFIFFITIFVSSFLITLFLPNDLLFIEQIKSFFYIYILLFVWSIFIYFYNRKIILTNSKDINANSLFFHIISILSLNIWTLLFIRKQKKEK